MRCLRFIYRLSWGYWVLDLENTKTVSAFETSVISNVATQRSNLEEHSPCNIFTVCMTQTDTRGKAILRVNFRTPCCGSCTAGCSNQFNWSGLNRVKADVLSSGKNKVSEYTAVVISSIKSNQPTGFTLWHRIISHHNMTPQYITSQYDTILYHITMWHHIISHHNVTPYYITPQYDTILYHIIMWHHIISHHNMTPYYITSQYDTILYHIIMWHHIISHHNVTPSYITSQCDTIL